MNTPSFHGFVLAVFPTCSCTHMLLQGHASLFSSSLLLFLPSVFLAFLLKYFFPFLSLSSFFLSSLIITFCLPFFLNSCKKHGKRCNDVHKHTFTHTHRTRTHTGSQGNHSSKADKGKHPGFLACWESLCVVFVLEASAEGAGL